MAIDDFTAATAALDAVQSGLSARQGLIEFRAAGGHIANETWFRLVGEIQATLASREGILDEPVNQIPTAGEIQQWTTNKASGFIQQVEVLARDKATGQVVSIPYSSVGSSLRSRREVLAEALSVYSDEQADRYGQSILGAVYTGSYQAVPRST